MILSCDKTDQHLFIEGCMYENACNYNPEATANDDSCLYNDCIGVCGGDAVFDECDICDGNNSTCSDCDGVPNGESYLDCCGNCDMNSTNDCLLIQDLCIYDVEISVCGLEYLGLNEAIFTICADSPEYHISGFQFAFNASNFNISEVTLGEDAELANMVNYAESDLFALAVSYPMSYIPSGSNLELVLFSKM